MPGPQPVDCIPLTVRIVGRGLDPSAGVCKEAVTHAVGGPDMRGPQVYGVAQGFSLP